MLAFGCTMVRIPAGGRMSRVRIVAVIIVVLAFFGRAHHEDFLFVGPALAAKSNQNVGDPNGAKAFARLIKRWNLTNDHEEEIAALERAIKIEPTLKTLPTGLQIQGSRNYVRWSLFNALGFSYFHRNRGDRRENIERAIKAFERVEHLLTHEEFPVEWATTQSNLGFAYRDRILGGRAENQERAIRALESALTVRTRDANPPDWAVALNELGALYWQRIGGERSDNLEQSIKSFEAILTLWTRENAPEQWARAEVGLADAYYDRIKGDRSENIELAIRYFEAAATVRTRKAYPRLWAETQTNLANAYLRRVRGVRDDNIDRAIGSYEAINEVFKRDSNPEEWANTQNNLAAAYLFREREDRAGNNTEKAIQFFEAALTVRTRERFPKLWAETQANLAEAYLNRIVGDRAKNVDRAVAYLTTALTVETVEAFPRDHLSHGHTLGQIFFEKGDWQAAEAAYRSAREAFLILFGQGFEEFEAQDVIATAGPLFAESAYVAAEKGDAARALSLLSEGKARLISVTLRQNSIDLPPEKAAQLAALRKEIRDVIPKAEAKGDDGARALEQLKRLRIELSGLLKSTPGPEAGSAEKLRLGRDLLPEGGAVVAPVVTKIGGKLLVLVSTEDGATVTAINLPRLKTGSVDDLMKGAADKAHNDGWLSRYNINYELPITLQELKLSLDDPKRKQALIADYRRLKDLWRAEITAIGRRLWDLFVGDVIEALKTSGVPEGSRIVLLPPGELGLLPLGLAESPTGRRLFEMYEISYAPSLGVLGPARMLEPPRKASLAAVVNPTGDLTGASLEGLMVMHYFSNRPAQVLGPQTATQKAVMEALSSSSYWHFATHGIFNRKNPRDSASSRSRPCLARRPCVASVLSFRSRS
jgi:tetratricopeptide (TPR) repeat protein